MFSQCFSLRDFLVEIKFLCSSFLPSLGGSIFSVLTFILKEQFVFFPSDFKGTVCVFSRRTLKGLFVFFPFGH